MFFSNNFDYMQDLNFYNQNPNTYANNGFQTQNMFYPNQTMNLSYFYPSLYKILVPVIIRVISTSNYQYLNDDVINNMVDSVYNIVEGDITKDENNNDAQPNNQQSNYQAGRTNDSKQDKNKDLIKDIIKILIIKELQNRQIRQMNQNLYNQF